MLGRKGGTMRSGYFVLPIVNFLGREAGRLPSDRYTLLQPKMILLQKNH